MELTNTEKAALMLLSLGKDLASKIFRCLTDTEVKRIARAFTTVSEVDRDTQLNVVAEFRTMLKAGDKMLVDGRSFATDLLKQAFGDSDSEHMLEFMTGARKEEISNLFRDVPLKILNSFVTSEHPQTVAFLMAKMNPDQAAQILQNFTEEQQTEVVLRISNLNNVKTEVVDEVREVLRTSLLTSDSNREEISGTKAAAEILNFFDRSNEERTLSEIEEMYPDLAEEIRNLMFTFEDITKVDDRGVQTVLKEIPRDILVMALKTASEELSDRFKRNMSQRAVAMILEDMDALGPVKLKDVEKAQQSIIDVVRRLEAEGKIAISGGGDEDMLV